jgi:hypothetical protein
MRTLDEDEALNKAKDIQDMESRMDSVVHELIYAITDSAMPLISEYYVWQKKVQAKIKELHPDFEFENF